MASLDTNWSDVADDLIPAIDHNPDDDSAPLPIGRSRFLQAQKVQALHRFPDGHLVEYLI
jgi:hypothetical protein